MSLDLPAPIARYIAAENQGDTALGPGRRQGRVAGDPPVSDLPEMP